LSGVEKPNKGEPQRAAKNFTIIVRDKITTKEEEEPKRNECVATKTLRRLVRAIISNK
jgi:hypothetical protein